jgi:putative holliday junction resolvase
MPSSACNKPVPHHTAVNSAPAPTHILAIDYGRKRIGLALSDELGITARPLATIERSNRRNDLRRLRDVCARHRIARIIVGYPLHLDGSAGQMAVEAASFAARVQKALGVPVDLLDERLTSWQAQQTTAELRTASRKKRRPLDEIAAAVLLREYLDRRRFLAAASTGELHR